MKRNTRWPPNKCEFFCSSKPWKPRHQLANVELKNTKPRTEEVTNASHSVVAPKHAIKTIDLFDTNSWWSGMLAIEQDEMKTNFRVIKKNYKLNH